MRTVSSPDRGPTTTRSVSGSSPRHARWLVSACRSDGKRGASVRIFRRAPSGRKNEASIRCRFTVSVLRIATSDGRAPTIRAIGSRNVSSYVNHGPSGRNQPSTPRWAQRSSSASIAGRTSFAWSPSELPAR